jgi:hypothetical protein
VARQLIIEATVEENKALFLEVVAMVREKM